MDKLVGIAILGYLIVYIVDRVLYLKKGTAPRVEYSEGKSAPGNVRGERHHLSSLNRKEESLLSTGR